METIVRPLDVPTAIRQRRSIKTFKTDPLAPELLHQLVELTVAAPSSYNLQDWRIVLVQSTEQRAALAAASYNQKQIIEAPVTFVFAADSESYRENLDQIVAQGQETGAWSAGTASYFRQIIPQYQEGLGSLKREFAVKDAIIAATHLVLAAESLGLATCFMNGWVEDQVKAVIGANDRPNIAIAVLVPVGYPNEARLDPGRLPRATNVFSERLGQPYQS